MGLLNLLDVCSLLSVLFPFSNRQVKRLGLPNLQLYPPFTQSSILILYPQLELFPGCLLCAFAFLYSLH